MTPIPANAYRHSEHQSGTTPAWCATTREPPYGAFPHSGVFTHDIQAFQ
jgi:hypothetical protein